MLSRVLTVKFESGYLKAKSRQVCIVVFVITMIVKCLSTQTILPSPEVLDESPPEL